MSEYYIQIDDAAAESDIRQLKTAVDILTQADHTINQLHITAQGIKGETGSAIQEKTLQLRKRIAELIEGLNSASGLISKTVTEYHQMDQNLKGQIGGM